MMRIARVVSLWVYPGQEEAFANFEIEAARVMGKFGGSIDAAARISEVGSADPADSPFEVHFVSFPDNESFEAYRGSSEVLGLVARRSAIIVHTQVEEGRVSGPY